ncbi:MAG: LPS assembly lipoprotein LptE [Sulfurovum sp.]|nr:LPS assembly lipoprotein LptE [Sulfurovum sp.]
MKLFLLSLSLLVLTACGYKPSSHYIKHIFEDAIYVEVEVDAIEPENAPFIKDEMNRLIYTRFKGRVVSKKEAGSSIHIRYGGSSFFPLAYEDGYVTRYRVIVRVTFTMETKAGRLTKSIASRVESDIQASSLTSSTLRVEAIRKGLSKALDEFLAYVSVKGMIIEEKKQIK